jgi:hypothetical protein
MAVKTLPKWAMHRYAKLWNRFRIKEFTYKEASEVLKEKDKNLTSVALSYLRKYGWLTTKLHPIDTRKRIYQLKTPEEAIKEMEK